MRKVLLTATIALSVFLGSCNSDKKAAGESDSASGDSLAVGSTEDGAGIKFEKNSFDFGKVKSGEKVTHEFKFVNTGKSPLIISNATASCGCTVPEFPHEPIPAGGSGVIKVVFDSANRTGMQHKVVTVTSNAATPTTEVFLVGEVEGN